MGPLTGTREYRHHARCLSGLSGICCPAAVRRVPAPEELVANLNQIPDTVTLAAVGIEYTVGVSPLLDRIV